MVIKVAVSAIIIALTCLQAEQLISAEVCAVKNSTSWLTLKEYPKLAELVESTLSTDNITDGGHSLTFVNWQETTLRLSCPENDTNDEYIWTQRCHSDDKDKSFKECQEFDEQGHSSPRLIAPSPHRCGEEKKLFRTYSCETVSNKCKHYVHVFIRPVLKTTTTPDQIPLGKKGTIICESVRCKKANNSDEEVDSMLGPFSMTWRGPNGLDLEQSPTINVTYEYEKQDDDNEHDEENTPRVPYKSTVHINKATPETTGIFECVLTSMNYGINFTGSAQVTLVPRPTWVIYIPIGIIVILFAVLLLMIRFCPERVDEADVDVDSEDEVAATKRGLKIGEIAAGKNGLSQIQEEKESLDVDSAQSSARNSGAGADNKKDD